MTVQELIDMLTNCDANTQVIVAKDSEGNGFSPMDAVYSEGRYEAETTWSGKFTSADDPELNPGTGTPAVVLWPVN